MSFPFIKLPPEIRYMIYCSFLTQGKDIHVTKKVYHPFPWAGHVLDEPKRATYQTLEEHTYGNADGTKTCYILDPSTPVDLFQFLAINHQIQAETAPIIYGFNTFHFEDECTVIPFLQDRTPLFRSYIKHLHLHIRIKRSTVTCQCRLWKQVCHYLEQQLVLETLKIDFTDRIHELLRDTHTLGERKLCLLPSLPNMIHPEPSHLEPAFPAETQRFLDALDRGQPGFTCPDYHGAVTFAWRRKS